MLKASMRGQVPPFIVMDVMREANNLETKGRDILHLEVGQPGTGAPKGVIDCISKKISEQLGYTDAFGLRQLRVRIAQHYLDYYNLTVAADRIAITTGSSAAFVLSFVAAFDPGETVAIVSPGYPAYRNILTSLGLTVAEISVGPETNFELTLDLLEAIPGPIDGLIIASPSNPTGTMISKDHLEKICHYCFSKNIRLVSDEIYHGITFGDIAQTALKFNNNSIIVNSFSKYFSMTGWRVGWCVLPEDLIRPVECLSQNFYISAPTLSQYGALAAFGCTEELELNVKRYAINRKILLQALPKAGFSELATTDGAFYIYANIEKFDEKSPEFCSRTLNELGVAITPGIDFDPLNGAKYVRFSFSGRTEDIQEASRRLISWYSQTK